MGTPDTAPSRARSDPGLASWSGIDLRGTSAGSPSTASDAPISELYFGTLAAGRIRFGVYVLVGIGVFGVLALPLAGSVAVAVYVTATLAALFAAIAAVFLASKNPAARTRYDLAMAAALAVSPFVVQFLDPAGPLVGAVAVVLILHNLDASRRVALTTTLFVGAIAVGCHALLTAGLVPRIGLLRTEPDLPVELSNLLTTALIYAMSYVLPLVFRRRTAVHLEELAAAGRAIAARDALLREARLDLERVAAVGQRGRFTDQRLGSFVLGNILGRGGMGEVYEAVQVDTGARAALKLLRLGGSESGDVLHRFVREAALIRALESPHVVALLEVGGMEAPLPYFAMERLEGEDLAQVLRRGKPSIATVVDMVRQVASGLLVAKARGVVHRDIKPSNLFRTRDGVWKVLDFGVSRLAGGAGTLTGNALVGTVGYLAPEQVDGRGDVSHATDLHALATVTYRALTGRPAFVARDPADILHEVESVLPLPPSHFGLADAFDDVLLVAMAKEPADRFADAGAFADALASAARDEVSTDVRRRARALARTMPWAEPESARPPPPPRPAPRDSSPPTSAITSSGETARVTPPFTGPPEATARMVGTMSGETAALTPTAPPARPPQSAPSSALPDALASPTVTLVSGDTSEIVRSMSLARARAIAPILAIGGVFAFTQLPLNRHPGMIAFGAMATALLTMELVAIGVLSKAATERGLKRVTVLVLAALLTSLSLVYYFQVGGIVSAYVSLALLVYTFGARPRDAALALGLVAVPHALMHLGVTAGALPDRGVFDVRAGTAARLLNLGHAMFVYGAAFALGRLVRERSLATIGEVSTAFRQLAEREALLRDARRELERAVGVGQPGRFSEQRIGRFTLGNVLGRGGMGEVYAAEDDAGASIAVKLLLRPFGRSAAEGGAPGPSGSSAIERFLGEARIVAGIASPHVVRVVDFGTGEHGLPWIAMERLVGDDLGVLLQQRLALPPAEVAELVRQIAAGLAAAHRSSVLHLDVKPQNLFRTKEGVWKLLDFGIATLVGADDTETHAPRAGTPAFMAPEQLAGSSRLDPRADVHALAAVAYRALTGRPAFTGRDGAAVVRQVLDRLPERPSTVADLPAAVDDVLLVALAKRAAHRFASAAAFATAFGDALEGKITPETAASARRLEQILDWKRSTRAAVAARR